MIANLARASLEGAVLASVVWLACRLLPRLSPSVRVALWWCVAAKFAVSLMSVSAIALPLLPARSNDVAARSGAAEIAAARDAPDVTRPRTLTVPTDAPAPASTLSSVLLMLWGAGASVALVLSYRGWRRTRRAVACARPADPDTVTLLRELATLVRVRRHVDVRLSRDVESPMITGIRHPVILLPMHRFASLSREQQRMALCHELVHLRRGDVWLGCLPATVERLFFFHPLARLAAREYAFWREAACDAETLTALHGSAHGYGHLLLTFGAPRSTATFAAAGAGGTFDNLKRRIEMLGTSSTPSLGMRLIASIVVALAVVSIAPVKAVARTAIVTASVAPGPTPQVTSVPTPRPTPPFAVDDAALAPAVERSVAMRSPSVTPVPSGTSDAAQRELRFVFYHDERVTTMSGSMRDRERADLQRRGGERLLWFTLDGDEYVVRDPGVHRELERLYEPMNALSERQAEVSKRQATLSEQQGQISGMQGRYSTLQGVASSKQGKASALLSQISAREIGATADERRSLAQERELILKDLAMLDDEMKELTREIRSYDAPMRELSLQIGEMSREIGEYSRQIEAASRDAKEGMRALVARTIRDGTAQRVR